MPASHLVTQACMSSPKLGFRKGFGGWGLQTCFSFFNNNFFFGWGAGLRGVKGDLGAWGRLGVETWQNSTGQGVEHQGRAGHGRDTAGQGGTGRDTGGTRAGHGRDMGGTLAGHWRDMGGTLAGHGRDAGGTGAGRGRDGTRERHPQYTIERKTRTGRDMGGTPPHPKTLLKSLLPTKKTPPKPHGAQKPLRHAFSLAVKCSSQCHRARAPSGFCPGRHTGKNLQNLLAQGQKPIECLKPLRLLCLLSGSGSSAACRPSCARLRLCHSLLRLGPGPLCLCRPTLLPLPLFPASWCTEQPHPSPALLGGPSAL